MVLLKACEAIENEVGKGLNGRLVDQLFELEDNEAYLYQNMESDENISKNNWLVENSESKDSDTEATSRNTFSN